MLGVKVNWVYKDGQTDRWIDCLELNVFMKTGGRMDGFIWMDVLSFIITPPFSNAIAEWVKILLAGLDFKI